MLREYEYDVSQFKELEEANERETFLNKWRRFNATPPYYIYNHTETISATMHFAIKNDKTRIEWLRTAAQSNCNLRDPNYRNPHTIEEELARGYAIAGNYDEVEACLRNGAKINYICRLLVKLNDPKGIQICQAHKADPDLMARCHARAGHHLEVEQYYIKNGEPLSIAHSYHYAKDYKNELIYLLRDYIDTRKNVKDPSGQQTKQYCRPFFVPGQKSFSQKENAVEALQQALKENQYVDLKQHLSTLRNGKLGETLRDFIKDGKANELVGKKVHTVTEFVKEFQKQLDKRPQSENPGISPTRG